MGDKDKGKGTPTPNQTVHHWARGKLGQRIGKGECWDLAEQAVHTAGAHGSEDLGPMGDDADYVWGDRVELTDARPGDILQFRDYKVTTRTETLVDFGDGTSTTKWHEETKTRPHHTAVVDHVMDPQKLRVIEQNAPEGSAVKLTEMPTTSKRSTAQSHKSVPDLAGKKRPGKVTVTTIVTVTGTLTAYRPKPTDKPKKEPNNKPKKKSKLKPKAKN